MNSCVFIGRLTREPEVSQIPMKDGSQLDKCRINIAIDRPGTYGDSKKTDFIPITILGKQAASAGKYLAKGRQVAVMCQVQTGSYQNKEGVTVYTTDFVANRVEFLGSGTGSAKNAEEKLTEENMDNFESAEDDIPF